MMKNEFTEIEVVSSLDASREKNLAARNWLVRILLTQLNLCRKTTLLIKMRLFCSAAAAVLNALEPDNFFFEIFDGGHDFEPERAFAWFDKLLDKTHSATTLTG